MPFQALCTRLASATADNDRWLRPLGFVIHKASRERAGLSTNKHKLRKLATMDSVGAKGRPSAEEAVLGDKVSRIVFRTRDQIAMQESLSSLNLLTVRRVRLTKVQGRRRLKIRDTGRSVLGSQSERRMAAER